MKRFGLFACGAVVGAALTIVIGCLQLKSPETVIREPMAPDESTVEYHPPPGPDMPVEMLEKYLPMLRQMITPKVLRVADGIYLATGFSFANVGMVVTDEGLVIVDTSESEEAAREILTAFRKITDLPIRYIVYTHFHNDHTGGGAVFLEDSPRAEIIATRDFLYWYKLMWDTLGPYNRWTATVQSGMVLPEYGFPLPVKRTPYRDVDKIKLAPMPTLTFEKEHKFTLGGVRFELFTHKGETHDHLGVRIPERRICFGGDAFYPSWPQLRTPMREPQRPVLEWAGGLKRLIDLNPEILVVGHGPPLTGADNIRETLGNYREAIIYIHDETVRYINEGKSADQAAREIKLPGRLANKPCLQELYGRMEWSIKGIYHGYTGWYHGGGTGLHPLPASYLAREVVALAGGADKLLTRAIELQQNQEHQLCAELCDVVIAANPDDLLAHRVKAESMRHLAYAYQNLNCMGFYRSAYSEEMKLSGAAPGH